MLVYALEPRSLSCLGQLTSPAPRSPCSPVGYASSQLSHVGTRGSHPPESGSWEEPIPPTDGVDGLGSWQSASSERIGAPAWPKTSLLVCPPMLSGAVCHIGRAKSPPRTKAMYGGLQRHKIVKGEYPARAPKSLLSQLHRVLQWPSLSPPEAEYESRCRGQQ